MQTLKGLLERWAELVKQTRLACEYRIPSTRWRLDHAEESVRGRVEFIAMVSVIFHANVTVHPNVSGKSQ